MEEVGKETAKYNIDITAVQEVRWKIDEKITIGEYTFFYSVENK